jgi:hypothetical protein
VPVKIRSHTLLAREILALAINHLVMTASTQSAYDSKTGELLCSLEDEAMSVRGSRVLCYRSGAARAGSDDLVCNNGIH